MSSANPSDLADALDRLVATTIEGSPYGTISVLVTDRYYHPIYEHDVLQDFFALSLPKPFIVMRLLFLVGEKRCRLGEPVVLHEADRRGGTGWEQYAKAGSEFPFESLLESAITASSNTAVNMLLRHTDITQRHINEWLHGLGITQTGLTDRTDCLFESDVMHARGAIEMVRCCNEPKGIAFILNDYLSRSDFTWGMRGGNRPSPLIERVRGGILKAGKLLGGFEPQGFAYRSLVRSTPVGRSPIASKWAIDPDEEELHEVAFRIGSDDSKPTWYAAVMTRGLTDAPGFLAAVGRLLMNG